MTCFGLFIHSLVTRCLIRRWSTGNKIIPKPSMVSQKLKNTMVFSCSWWIDFCRSEWASATLETTLWQNGDSLPSNVQLLKNYNVELININKNGFFRSCETHKSKDQHAMCIVLWSSYHFAMQVYIDSETFAEKC